MVFLKLIPSLELFDFKIQTFSKLATQIMAEILKSPVWSGAVCRWASSCYCTDEGASSKTHGNDGGCQPSRSNSRQRCVMCHLDLNAYGTGDKRLGRPKSCRGIQIGASQRNFFNPRSVDPPKTSPVTYPHSHRIPFR